MSAARRTSTMPKRKGFLSSEDELTGGPIQEPARYEFQSFLSDNEDMPDAVPEPPAPDESPAGSAPPILSDMLHTLVDGHEAPSSNNGYANGSVKSATGSFRGSFTRSVTGRSVTGSVSDIHGHDVRIVDIEVGLKWLSPAQRAAFEYVEMDEDELAPTADYRSPRRLRRRRKVRRIPTGRVAVGFVPFSS
jgi:hypothetical protein